MATKLYFHNALSSDTGTLPTTTQSGSTINATADAQSVNRSMNLKIGTSQTSLVVATLASASAQNLYFTKFVSPRLKGTSVAANTWTFQFAGQESNAAANFPVTTSAALVKIVAYVWDAVTGTKIGNILIGNGGTYAEAGTAETALTGTFTGAAVSGFNAGNCVIIIEIFFTVTQGGATSRNDTFYYDGTTEASTTTNAAFLSTPETIGFKFSTSVSDTPAFIDAVNKKITKAVIDTNAFIDTVQATKTSGKQFSQSVSDTISFIDIVSKKTTKSLSDSLTITELLSKGTTKNLSDIVQLIDTISKRYAKSITDSLTTSEFLSKGITYHVNDPIALTDQLSKSISKSIQDDITLDDIKSKGIQKAIEDNIQFSDDVQPTKSGSGVLYNQLVDDILSFGDLVVIERKTPTKTRLELVSPRGPFIRLIPKTIALEINITGKITLSEQQKRQKIARKKQIEDLKTLRDLIELL